VTAVPYSIHAVVTLVRQILEWIQNCGQTAADSDVITFDSLYEFPIVLSNCTIADFLWHTV